MKIKCPGCAALLNVPDSAAGKVVKCPCGKQLRAPARSAPAGNAPAARTAPKPGTAAAPRAARPVARPAAKRPAAPGGAGGLDADMFDELTEGDLKPVAAVARPGVAKRMPAAGGNKTLEMHASGDVRGTKASFRRGPLASPWIRLGAAFIDGMIFNFLFMPVFLVCWFLLFPLLLGLFVSPGALDNPDAMTQAQKEAAIAGMATGAFIAYLISAAISLSIPVTINAVMVTKSGQTIGKMLCKIRIINKDSGELPGFVSGVLIRSWAIHVLYSIPLVGGIVALVDPCMIFGGEPPLLARYLRRYGRG